MKKTIRSLLFIIALSVLLFSSYKVINYYLEEKESTDLIASTKFEYVAPTDTGGISVNYAAIKDIYPDFVAWLYQPGTNINYPVVQSIDNDYYLRRLIDGSHNMNGTLFIDYRNACDFSDYITMLYGHNMKNGEMFSTFPNYTKQEYYDNHPEMMRYTPTGDYKIKLFAGYLTDDTDEIYSFAENSLGAEYLFNTALKKSEFKSDISVYNGEKLLVLSTCSYEKSNSRFVLVGILDEK